MECEYPDCDSDDALTVTCNYCDDTYCSQHRLPEKHDCVHLEGVQATHAGGGTTTMSQSEIDRRARKANKRRCAECSNYTTADHELCKTCRAKASIPEAAKSSEVTLKDPADKRDSTPSSTQPSPTRRVLRSIKIRLETIYIRIRGWITTLLQVAAIGVFLLGVWAAMIARRFSVGGVTFLGYDVPPLILESPYWTLFVGGIGMIVIGLALSMKILTGSTAPKMSH